ncbi:hypothetical protein ASPZODRAFT_166709 [Penicilliopsis zonata CBS 506.65]|uniref:Uncharacterized protein n=1 Tax=Penicilliopsis zonata CBS 506.65 TaxID=1073090 RepID=A0A1L9SH96_9EURO|nr:hypothetical protein ASPZODRAFT_166709 [Penicilliopsis zonata CBS 506.65]OJJ46456.1 hypothetical protein ASPZODRAFT_166709 [Penicilliopsis zonata CBS 506.65]
MKSFIIASLAVSAMASLPSKFTLTSSTLGNLVTDGVEIYVDDGASGLSILELTTKETDSGTVLTYNVSGVEKELGVYVGENEVAVFVVPGAARSADITVTGYGESDGYFTQGGEQTWAFNTSAEGAKALWWMADLSDPEEDFSIVQLSVETA